MQNPIVLASRPTPAAPAPAPACHASPASPPPPHSETHPPTAGPPTAGPPAAGAFSDEQKRERGEIHSAVSCDIRYQILLTLAAAGRGAGPGGRMSVGELALRIETDQKTLSTHLGQLRHLGLVFDRRDGQAQTLPNR